VCGRVDGWLGKWKKEKEENKRRSNLNKRK